MQYSVAGLNSQLTGGEMSMSLKTNKKGFTLIELLVVVLIIGILASMAIPQYFKVVEKARVAEAMSLISSIKSAQERYLATGGNYTDDYTKLDISYAGVLAGSIALKFFEAQAITLGTGSDPSYTLTVKRKTDRASVAARYGEYALTLTVPTAPEPTCTGNCATELLQ